MIYLEGEEEIIEETLFESPRGFTFWYASDRLEAYDGEAENVAGVIVKALYSDDHLILSMISEEDAKEYCKGLDENIVKLFPSYCSQVDVYRNAEDGTIRFLTLIGENGHYCRAVGEYSEEAAEGNAKFFQRVLDSVNFDFDYDADFLRELPGQWAEEEEGVGTVLTLTENWEMSLYFYGLNGEFAYTYAGTWSYTHDPKYSPRLTLRFTSTDNPAYAGSEYSVECAYAAYTESWIENDTELTYLLLNPPLGCTGVSPFEEVYGTDMAAVHRERKPNMKVVKCKEFVSLRETRSTSAKRLAKVPLGALVLAFPECGEENGFIYCVYHDEEGFILAEYLQPIE